MTTGLMYLIAAVAFGGSFAVRWWLKKTYTTWNQVPNIYGVTGAQTAATILKANGVDHVTIEPVRGRLTDHYDPQRDILRLSVGNYQGTSVAAMAVSAHEAGHALQDATSDVRLRLRRLLVPIAALGGRLGPYIIIGSLFLGSPGLLQIGVILLAGTMIFQLATLPVEFNASRCALKSLEEIGVSDPQQRDGIKRVLTAAAMTYVAAAATSIAYFLFLAGGRRGGAV